MKKFFEQKKSALVSGMNSNKGFSLVELIIVVAIMAVLMGVLAPQYLRFVESSREQTDVSAANDIVKVMRIAIATMDKIPTEETVTWVSDGSSTTYLTVTGGAGSTSELLKEMELTLGTGGASIGAAASTLYNKTDAANLTFRVAQDSNGVPFVYTGSSWISYNLGIPKSSSLTDIVTDEPSR